jgi:Holliday junction resolvase RusA-like endonuclease
LFIKSINARLWMTIADGNLWSGIYVKLPGHVGPKRRRVEIVSFRARYLDKDNLYGGAKVLVDAIRDIGMIVNDSPKWIDLKVRQRLDRANQRTEIKIAEII